MDKWLRRSRSATVKHGENLYRYMYNLQGDIGEMIDGADTLVLECKCDVWGKPFSIAGPLKCR